MRQRPVLESSINCQFEVNSVAVRCVQNREGVVNPGFELGKRDYNKRCNERRSHAIQSAVPGKAITETAG
jgi:hypothetical protein